MFFIGSTRCVLVCGNELRINDSLTRCRLRETAKQFRGHCRIQVFDYFLTRKVLDHIEVIVPIIGSHDRTFLLGRV